MLTINKPDGRVFDPASTRLGELGIKRSNVLYVGDALIDHQAALHASIGFIGVTTGFVTAEKSKEAGASALTRLSELPTYISKRLHKPDI